MWISDVAMNTWMRGVLGVAHRLPRPVDVLEPGARQRRDDRAAHGLGDRLDRLEVAVARDREAGLDDVDTEARELLGDLELLADVERDAGRLLAVPQGRVEDHHRVHARSLSIRKFRATKNPPAEGTEGESASTEGCSPLHKEEAQRAAEAVVSLLISPIICTGSAAQVKPIRRRRADSAESISDGAGR